MTRVLIINVNYCYSTLTPQTRDCLNADHNRSSLTLASRFLTSIQGSIFRRSRAVGTTVEPVQSNMTSSSYYPWLPEGCREEVRSTLLNLHILTCPHPHPPPPKTNPNSELSLVFCLLPFDIRMISSCTLYRDTQADLVLQRDI